MADSDNSLRDHIDKAFEGVEEIPEVEATTVEAKAEEKPQEEANVPERDEQGRFVAKEKEEAESEETISADAETAAVEAQPETPPRKAPSSWKKQEQELYASLDPSIQDIIDRRESDFHNGLTGYKTKAEQADAWNEALQPYQAQINALGITPQQAATTLFNADHMLRTGTPAQKAQMFYKIANDYGVDLTQLPEAQYIDPNTAYLQQQIANLQQQFSNQNQQAEQTELDSYRAEAEELSRELPLWEEAKPTMRQLLDAGMATSFEDAYEKAVNMVPELREQNAALLQQQASQEQAANEKKIAAAAKQKAASVKGAPSGGSTISPQSTGNLRDDLTRAVENMAGGHI